MYSPAGHFPQDTLVDTRKYLVSLTNICYVSATCQQYTGLRNIPPLQKTKSTTVYVGGASQVTLVVKNPPASAGDGRDVHLISGSGRSPRGRRGNPLQYSCLENPMDRGVWQVMVHGVMESDTTEYAHTCVYAFNQFDLLHQFGVILTYHFTSFIFSAN